ncbi:alpha-amylase family glycosyl hydrolase [Saccharothrix lopnurensis]|uniref:Alpha-amylase family glycosyl hydrolase n=1 Tax=Saccharothrix lopnurensis TaxID=1670621 RepID=A0ABW1PE54_9PSEU
MYPRSFADSDGDGVGDLDGLTGRLDHIAGLGADALWLSPVYSSPMRDFGYDVADHTSVDPLFGDLAGFRRLLADAHALGLRVLVDFVPNHTSDLHPWFTASRSSRADPQRKWYHWRDPAPGGGPPNNWLGTFGGPAWTLDERTGQYYLHSFLPQMPDLDWRNPEVRAAMADVVRFWLDLGVDGLRVDCAAAIGKDPGLRDNPPAPPGALAMHRPLAEYDSQAHVHDAGHPDAHDWYRALRALVDGYPGDRVVLGEVHERDPARWAAYYGRDLDGIHLPFAFGLLACRPTAEGVRAVVVDALAAVPAGAVPCWVLGNHDERRVVSRFGADRARLLVVLLLTLPGAAVLYYGDELGLPDAETAPGQVRDPWALVHPDLGRDPARAPVPWTDEPGRGFTTGEPWLPFPVAASVAAQDADPGSTLALTRALGRFRAGSRVVREGSLEFVDTGSAGTGSAGTALGDVLAYRRVLPGEPEVLVLLNFGDGAVGFDLPANRRWAPVMYTVRSRPIANRVEIGPLEGLVVREQGLG